MSANPVELAERVARGAALLDARLPGWVEAIDPDQLDMRFVEDDILGHLYGHFDDGTAALTRDAPEPFDEDVWATQHGFYFTADEPHDFDELTACWRAELARRRAGDGR